jgi:D-inositol-3-phosphate glycosyltransferase
MLRVAMISVHTCPLARLGSRETGGMNVYIRELSRHLGARGVAVDVFTRRQDPTVQEVVEFGPNARVIHLDAGPPRPLDKYRVLDHLPEFAENVGRFRALAGRDYDVVHSHYWLSGPVAMSLADDWDVPMVAMFHTLGRVKNNVSRDGHEREHSVRIDIEQSVMDAADAIVAASPTDMEHMASYYEAQSSRIRVIPEGVDTSVFRPYQRSAARAKVGMGEESQLLFVGRIQRLKGIDLLLKAFAILLRGWQRGPSPHLTVVGGSSAAGSADPEVEERRRLQELAETLGVADHVTFQDAVPHEQLPYYYSAADVVVAPSTYESFGLVALEAMASGTPVVASRVGGLQWTVRDGETGVLVPRRSPEQFASALGRLLGDDSLRGRMARSAVQAAEDYSWDAVADRVMSLYGSLMPCACACGGLASCRG